LAALLPITSIRENGSRDRIGDVVMIHRNAYTAQKSARVGSKELDRLMYKKLDGRRLCQIVIHSLNPTDFIDEITNVVATAHSLASKRSRQVQY
jgi:hypothetical protein